MFVIALNRKKMLTSFKVGLLIVVALLFLAIAFQQLEKKVSFDNWSSSNEHPGRVLRVNFGK